MDDIVAAASAAIGEPLTDPVDLGGSSRTTVVRCTRAGGTVIVKAYAGSRSVANTSSLVKTRDGFTAESTGLAFAHAALPGLGPRVLGVDRDVPLVVMSDLGDWPSMADALLGNDADTARAALRDWASAYGRIAVASIGREAELPPRPAAAPNDLAPALACFGVAEPAGLAADLAATEDAGGYDVFSPGDICPDNNLCTPAGFRVLDFEGAGFHSVFRDAAYTRMPFATCWCVFRLPDDVRAEVASTYRDEIVAGYPALADDARWLPGVRNAMAYWTVDITAQLGPRAMKADFPMHSKRHSPTVRQLLRYRWAGAADELGAAGELPALAGVFTALLAATEHWNVPPLPYYPAFG
jgi:hypothetical protein